MIEFRLEMASSVELKLVTINISMLRGNKFVNLLVAGSCLGERDLANNVAVLRDRESC